MINVDKLSRMPNQDIENRPQECVAETVTDIVGNIAGIPFDAGFTYATTLRLMGVAPTDAGSDPRTGMESAIFYGCLPTSSQPFDATLNGELYEANWKNYPADNFTAAIRYVQNGIRNLGSWQEILDHLTTYKTGVSLPVAWHQSFGNNDVNPLIKGVLPNPVGQYTNHNVAAYGVTDDGMLICKPWLGPTFGEGGYVYLSEQVYNIIRLEDAMGFDPNASRIWSIIGIAISHLPAFF